MYHSHQMLPKAVCYTRVGTLWFGGGKRDYVPNFSNSLGISEILMLHRKIFGLLLLIKIEVSSVIRKSLNMAPPFLYRYYDASDFSALKSSRDLGEKREITWGSIPLSMCI